MKMKKLTVFFYAINYTYHHSVSVSSSLFFPFLCFQSQFKVRECEMFGFYLDERYNG